MAQNITIAGAQYSDVPSIEVPKTDGSGNALFLDAEMFHISNRNILDNPWFTINQRQVSTVSAVLKADFCVDRWKIQYGTFVKKLIGITIAWDGHSAQGAIFSQTIEGDRVVFNKVYTLSVIINDVVYSGSFICDGGSHTVEFSGGLTGTVTGLDSGDLLISLGYRSTTAITIRAIKLERGPMSTLEYDVPPNYVDELLKCQRYFYRMHGAASKVIATTTAYNTTRLYPNVTHPVPMRTNPTVTASGDIGDVIKAVVSNTSGVTFDCTSLGVNANDPVKASLVLSTQFSGLTSGSPYKLQLMTGTYLDFSAEL